MLLRGRIAIVTGSNSGIGQVMAIALAREGAHVVISTRRQKQNEEIAQNLTRQFGVRTLSIATDVSREEECEQLILETVSELGALHLLANNAGIGGGSNIASTSTEDFDRILKTNLHGTFWCSRAAYRQMRRNPVEDGEPRGMIINISSVAGKQSWAGTGLIALRNLASWR